jgi:hypothetical protein
MPSLVIPIHIRIFQSCFVSVFFLHNSLYYQLYYGSCPLSCSGPVLFCYTRSLLRPDPIQRAPSFRPPPDETSRGEPASLAPSGPLLAKSPPTGTSTSVSDTSIVHCPLYRSPSLESYISIIIPRPGKLLLYRLQLQFLTFLDSHSHSAPLVVFAIAFRSYTLSFRFVLQYFLAPYNFPFPRARSLFPPRNSASQRPD